jgi:hypothetical protein
MKAPWKSYQALKPILVVAVAVLQLSNVEAQSKIHLGGRIGLLRSSIVQRMDLDYRSGAQLGGSVAALADIPLVRRFSLRPEVVFSYTGGSFLSINYADDLYRMRNTLKAYVLSVPVNIAYNIPFSGIQMTVFAGPVADVLLHQEFAGNQLYVGGADILYSPQQSVRSWDVGANAGIAVEYSGLFFSIHAQSGFVPIQIRRMGEARAYHNTLAFSLGYIIR